MGYRDYVLDRIPFTTYYPAIPVATLLGGFWLGTLASILSAAVAWWIFMPPAFGFGSGADARARIKDVRFRLKRDMLRVGIDFHKVPEAELRLAWSDQVV